MGEWHSTTWGNVITLQRGYDIVKSEQNLAGEVPVVSSGGVSSYHDQSMNSGPGVIIGRKGTLGRVHHVEGPFWPHDTTLWVRDFKGNFPRFVYYALKSIDPNFLNVGSASPTLNRNHIHPIPVRWPASSAEQRAIAEVLGSLDDKIAANNHIAETTKELLSTGFRSLRLDENPHSGETVTLRKLITANPRSPAPKSNPTVYLDMKNLPDQAMTVESWGQREPRGGARFQNGDTLLARITPCLENGKVGFVDFLEPGDVGVGSTEYIVLRSNHGIPTTLPYFLATSKRFREFAIRHMAGTSGRQRLAATDLEDFKVRRPEPELMAEFGRLADKLMPRVKASVDESRVLAQTRDELLPLLMSGKVRVRDAERTVEEVV